MTYDGLHLSGLGAYMFGRLLSREWRKIYAAGGALPFGSSEGSNLAGVNPVPMLSGQPYFGGTTGTPGAGATGTIAAGWDASALSSGITAAYGKITTPAFAGRSYADDGDLPFTKDWQKIVLGGIAITTGEVLVLGQSVGCTIGDALRTAAEIEVDAASTGISGMYVYAYRNGTGQQIRALGMPMVAATTPWPSGSIAGILRAPR